ncbi:MAG: CapA family protein [Anaerolineae bacterium]|nr:CapA family protein [Anaerolineae bacterium]
MKTQNTSRIVTKTVMLFLVIGTIAVSVAGCQQEPESHMPKFIDIKTPVTQTADDVLPTQEPFMAKTNDETDPAKSVDAIAFDVRFPEMLVSFLSGFTVTGPETEGSVRFSVREPLDDRVIVWKGDWIYAAATAFPTIRDDITSMELRSIWSGTCGSGCPFKQIYVSVETSRMISSIWGVGGETVAILDQDQITDQLWQDGSAVALVPFDRIEPQQKILSVDGIHPLERGLDLDSYALVIPLMGSVSSDQTQLSSELMAALANLPNTNRDERYLSNVMMTGVTALVRDTAKGMLELGVDYPANDIGALLVGADITHISNEVSFDENCPISRGTFSPSRFCTPPEFFDLLLATDIDVVELTGNHLLDYGESPFLNTLQMYRDSGIQVYGAGENLAEARKPLLINDHGNLIAFVGCNTAGPQEVYADDNLPGTAACDMAWLLQEITALRSQGYLVIVTFQYYESCQMEPMSGQKVDFSAAAEAGAVIVSGSQAHCPQAMTFNHGSFIHYGLGNLFFDQMWTAYRPAFLDVHTIYNGRYINTRLVTTMLEEAMRPRLMDKEERSHFLEQIFSMCEWGGSENE